MSEPAHPFDLALALAPDGDGRWNGVTSDDYWNMVGPFGGYVAALLYRAAEADPRRVGEAVALTVNFCAAVEKGAFAIEAVPVRTGGSTQHWTVAMTQDGATVATATALFAKRPDTFFHHPLAMPAVPAPDTLDRFGAFPSGWTARYDMRFAHGALDRDSGGQDGDGDTRSLLWIGAHPPRTNDVAGLVALCDVFFGRIIHLRRRMVPFGTVSMTAYFHCTADDLAALGTAPLLGDADARIFDRGFHDQTAHLWSPDGRLLATTHQLVYYRDPR